MCGIAGFINPGGHAFGQETLTRMIASIRYRGPDASGMYLDDHAGLGQVRLSIIDLESGNQPVRNEREDLWIVFNGEIFNYVELRADLQKKGHRFYTASDTEVLVHLYEEYDTGFLSMLNGQWAFALWDSRRRKCFIARDRVGIRPLYYTTHDGTFLFASEIKALFTIPEVKRELDPAGLDQVFTFWTTLPGQTIFNGISELPPAHYMTVTDNGIAVEKYWDIPLYEKDAWETASPEVLAEKTRDLLCDAVRIRLRADVPVATYLSGGLDSSGITAIVAKKFNPDVQTFGIRFEEEVFDEGRHQNEMVRFLGVKHHEVYATNKAIGESFAEVVRHCEKPVLRTAPVPLYLLAKLVRENGIKVVLTGEGADEFQGGYDIFKEALVRQFWARKPDSSWRGHLTGRLYPDIFRDERTRKSVQSFFRRGLAGAQDPLSSHMLRWNNTSRIKLFFTRPFQEEMNAHDPIADCRSLLPPGFASWHPLHRAQYLEISIFLSNYLLSSQGDRMGMAHSVEVRMPYLDHRLNDFLGRVPPWWKICGLHEKHVLKKALAPFLPESITARVKHPYRAPIHRSLLSILATDAGDAYLSEDALASAGLFDTGRVRALVRKLSEKQAGSETDTMALAGILSAQMIARDFIPAPWQVEVSDRPPDIVIDKRTKQGP
ncbi:MAG: asparagine synthase (glutamine-hydrolyzing) [Chitinispirillaceae bacterium]|nr:asparagine synthase (glutamine-hydrolyzing) [Chitinispirillaceae bacterium]